MWDCRLVCERLIENRPVEEEGDGADLHDAVAGEMERVVSAHNDHLAEEVVAFAKRQKFLFALFGRW